MHIVEYFQRNYLNWYSERSLCDGREMV